MIGAGTPRFIGAEFQDLVLEAALLAAKPDSGRGELEGSSQRSASNNRATDLVQRVAPWFEEGRAWE